MLRGDLWHNFQIGAVPLPAVIPACAHTNINDCQTILLDSVRIFKTNRLTDGFSSEVLGSLQIHKLMLCTSLERKDGYVSFRTTKGNVEACSEV